MPRSPNWQVYPRVRSGGYQQGGLERLKQDRYVGPTSELEQHAVSLREYFEKHPPASVKEAQHVIEQQTGVRREESQVRAFLHRLGMRCRQVGTVPGRLTEEQQAEQRRFLEEELSPKLDEAEAGKRKKFFVDASHFVHGAFVCRLWCFVRSFVRSPSGRKRWNVLGAVDFVTKQLLTVTNTTYITATTVCELLRLLAAEHPCVPITLVLDNARYQKCALVQDLAKQLGIELLYLPAYSPNLNLIERLWKYVKKDCLNRINTDGRDDMKTLLTRNFQLFDKRTFLAT
jgi:transposase